MLKEKGYEVHVAAKNNLADKNGLELKHADKFIEIPFSRSPKSLQNLKALKQLKKLLKEEYYDLIVCNTPMGGIITRMAAKKTRKKGTKVVYMAHGFHFYKGAPKKNWLVFYPIEKFMARHTDVLITINREDYALAKQRLKISNIYHINGIGVDFTRLQRDINREEERKQLGLTNTDFVLLSVGELNKNKNNIVVLQALKELKNEKVKYLIAGNGPLEQELKRKVLEWGLTNQVQFLGYTRDLAKYMYSVDAFCFVSYREGLGLAAIEAMYCGLPILTSNKHGINDYSIEGETGYKCEPNDYLALAKAIDKLYKNPEQCKNMGASNVRNAYKYEIKKISNALMKIVEDIICVE